MSDIHEGDEVSWNWGGGHPTGVAKEMKTTGKLEIKSNGKLVHKNADEDNPAVHVERGGNDVVKRASELKRLRGGGDEDNAQAGEAVVQEGGEPEEPKKTTRGGRRGGRKSTTETRKKQSEAGKKGGAATAAKKAGGRKRGKAAPEDAVVGEKREREGAVEEKGDVTAEQEKAEKEAGKEAKKAKVSPERHDDEYVPGEEPEEVVEQEVHTKAKPVETSAEGAGISKELKDLERDNRNLGLDVGAAEAEPRRAAETASGSTERTETAAVGEEVPIPTGEKKRGRKGATRSKAVA